MDSIHNLFLRLIVFYADSPFRIISEKLGIHQFQEVLDACSRRHGKRNYTSPLYFFKWLQPMYLNSYF
ncbi:MAG: hypothetical protein D6748_10350 [Calditrichaeota bacterium]|nr:MAG: hypothetical protein D6748_10350 [Calditrichota bacterium]